MLEAAFERSGLLVHQQIIWAKPAAVPGRSWFGWRHEPCLFGWRKGHKPRRAARGVLSSVWELEPAGRGGAARPDHPTPKPLGAFEFPIAQHTVGGDLCYEPFAGSGTQIVAAERTGRVCLAIERDPRYCDLIARRWLAFMGDRADPALRARYAAGPAPAGAPS